MVAFVVAIGLCILPALYAWFNIASNWDPYSNTGNIAVAVVNLDKGAKIGGISINAGEEIVSNLQSNTQMGWRFVSREEAQDGVNTGKYYASVLIPEDFSENLTSVLSGQLKRPQITYTLNEKLNAIAPKITDKGAEAIKNEVNQSYVDTITKTLAETISITAGTADSKYSEIKDNLTITVSDIIDDIDAAEKAIDMVVAAIDASELLLDDAKEGLPDVQQILVSAGVITDDTKKTINGASDAAASITDGAENVIMAVDSLYDSISPQLDSAFSQASSDAAAAADKFVRTAKINSQIVSLESRLVSFFQSIDDKLGINNSKIVTLLNNNIDKQNKIINKINEIADTVRKTGSVPENSKNDLDTMIAEGRTDINSVMNEYSQNVKPSVDKVVEDLFEGIDSVTSAMNNVDGNVPDIETALDTGMDSLTALKNALLGINTTLENGKSRLNNILDKIDDISDEQSLMNFVDSLTSAPTELGEFMSSPVKVMTVKVYPVENYGSAMAPFYSVLAIWVGSIVLIAVFRTDITAKDIKRLGGNVKPIEAYFGRYLIFLAAAVIQGLIIALGDVFFLGIQCCNIPLFILTAVYTAVIFSMFMYSLTITFSVIGKALAVIILVLQVAGSGGTYPPEVLPEFFQKLLPYLPFKYAVNAMRETVAGVYEKAYIYDMLMLLIYAAAALFIGIILRKPFLKIMNYFNKRMEETGLMV